MIIDVVGMRGTGKSTFCSLMKAHHNTLTREDRNKFEIPTWKEFTWEYPDLADWFMEEANNYRRFDTADRLPHRTIRRKKADFCLYAALHEQLKDKTFVWDKGLLETICYIHLHGEKGINMDKLFTLWPEDIVIVKMKSRQGYNRARSRQRHEQWDKKTYKRMQERHDSMMKWLPHMIVHNDESIDDLWNNYVSPFFDY